MKILLTEQIRQTDAMAIELEGITSVDLMDRAASALFRRIVKEILPGKRVLVLAGPGNNGGDALVIARLLIEAGHHVHTLLCHGYKKLSDDASIQLRRLQDMTRTGVHSLGSKEELSEFEGFDYIIDGLFGSGLNRPLEGYFAEIVRWANLQGAFRIAIDLPSGLFGEDNRSNVPENIIRADLVLGLQFPRLSFLLAENEPYIGKWELVDIGIPRQAIEEIATPWSFTEKEEMRSILKRRTRFSHKGTYGKGLLIAGSPGMMGAAVLASRGALRSGIGLLCSRIPTSEAPIVQISVPEAIVGKYDKGGFCAEADSIETASYSAIAIGPGIGTAMEQASSLRNMLKQGPGNLVLDADALNLLSGDRELIGLLPANTILTPHPKEFDRLAGASSHSGYERLERASGFAREHRSFLILKGAYTACIDPDGHCAFNSTGNPGMATGGSGDILTGIVLSLLSQGYLPKEACRLGVYLHGLAGDLALSGQSQESLMAGDIAENLGKAFNQLRNI